LIIVSCTTFMFEKIQWNRKINKGKDMKKIVLLGMFFLTGCGSPLTCNDSDAKEQVLVVIDSHLEGARWFQEMKPGLGDREIAGISTTDANEDLGRYSCTATYTFEFKGKTRDTSFSYDLNYLEDKGESEVLVDVNTIKDRYMVAAMGY